MSSNGRVCAIVVLAACAMLAACERPTPRGGDCTLNSDCAAPFVCRLDRCRRQCVSSRDCGGGILCVPDPVTGEGGCQLEAETRCALTSDCGGSFVCQFGTCTTECAEDRDCAPGAMCVEEGAGSDLACVEPIRSACVYDTDCPAPFSCGRDQLCALECVEQRDCPAPRLCVDNVCQLPDAGL